MFIFDACFLILKVQGLIGVVFQAAEESLNDLKGSPYKLEADLATGE